MHVHPLLLLTSLSLMSLDKTLLLLLHKLVPPDYFWPCSYTHSTCLYREALFLPPATKSLHPSLTLLVFYPIQVIWRIYLPTPITCLECPIMIWIFNSLAGCCDGCVLAQFEKPKKSLDEVRPWRPYHIPMHDPFYAQLLFLSNKTCNVWPLILKHTPSISLKYACPLGCSCLCQTLTRAYSYYWPHPC